MPHATTRARKRRRFHPTSAALEAREPVSSLALLPNLLDSFARAEAAAWLSPLQGDRDVWQSNRRVGSLGVNPTASGFEVYGDEAAVPMPRQWITSPTTDDDGVSAQGWSSTVAVPDALGAIASPSMPDTAAVALATGRGAAQPISGDTAALSVAAAIAGVMMATSVPSPPGVEQATDAEIRPMSLPPLVGTGADDPTLAALTDPGGSGGGSSGGSGGSGGGADLTISFTGGGAPVQVDGQYYDAIGNQVVVRVQGNNDMLTSVRWIVTGGVKDYTVTVDIAQVIPFGQVNENGQMVTGEDHTFNPATTSDTLGVIWDKAGTFTVTARATFSNNPSQSKSVTVNVQEPYVDSFKDEQQPLIFKSFGVLKPDGTLDYWAYG